MLINKDVGKDTYSIGLDYDDMVQWKPYKNEIVENGLSQKNMTGILYREVMDEINDYKLEQIEQWNDTLSYLNNTLK